MRSILEVCLPAGPVGVGLLLIFAVALGGCRGASTSQPQAAEARPKASPAGRSLGLASVPNLRDLGGYRTEDGRVVLSGKVYRSNQLSGLRPEDREALRALDLRRVYDLRTEAERDRRPDEVPPEAEYVVLDVLADAHQASAAELERLLHDPAQANAALGHGQAEAAFVEVYRQIVSLPSARRAYRSLFLGLADAGGLPAVFHCTTGKDRTGWAAAALLTLLGVPRDQVMEDYLASNRYILPAYRPRIDAFVAAGGDPSIPEALLGVRPAYIEASFDEMARRWGTIDRYFAEGLGIDAAGQQALRDRFLGAR